ncbi:epsilon subunit of F1F0-ATP synthase N-terminal domain-containing protein [Calocera viscosa TUFC12733]|uniref:ATP synthase subunit delta, mitochondrial n=1 Tax=Calocera viscosa (strain TUFC12733) TaxID=1330018 RepID=A0A167PNL9_CALVF|nr:epsilon subunit of F1F0-ATP synthase N-terminal domain-containing protein [Calocera viscosa TUFC12733]
MAFRLAARALPRRTSPAVSLARRGYAEGGPSNKIKLSLVLPHQTIFSSTEVTQVNLPAVSGDMGVLANHVPTIEPLRPGILDVIEAPGSSKKWFVSSGFATVHPDNTMTINIIEGAPLEDFSAEAVRSNLAEAQRVASGTGSEEEKAEARIEVEVYESLQASLR